MNNQGEVIVTWGDNDYCFRLTVAGLIELEQKCDAPFSTVWHRVVSGQYGINDIRETIRLGLIGGNMAPADALKLVRRQIDDRIGSVGFADHMNLARLILSGVMFGFEASPLGKEKAAPTPSTSASTPPVLSEPPVSLASDRTSLEEFHSGSWWQ